MGKNLPAEKYTIGEPTHRYLRYILDHSADAEDGYNDSHFIDLALGLSVVNRRAYRQGLYYYVNSVTVHDSNQDVWTKFACAADTWYNKNAWVRGFRHWSKMNSDAVTNGDDLDIAGKYHDFKIWLNNRHRTNQDGGDGNLLLPIGSQDYNSVTVSDGDWTQWQIDNAEFFAMDEWDYSKFNINGIDYDITLLDDTHDETSTGDPRRYSLLKGYGDTRITVPDEEPISEETMSSDLLLLLSAGDDQNVDVVETLEDDNDGAPYDNDYYGIPDTVVVSQTANSAGAGAVTRAPGFVCPFGLLEVITNSKTDGKVEVVVEIAAGKYNGVAAARVC